MSHKWPEFYLGINRPHARGQQLFHFFAATHMFGDFHPDSIHGGGHRPGARVPQQLGPFGV